MNFYKAIFSEEAIENTNCPSVIARGPPGPYPNTRAAKKTRAGCQSACTAGQKAARHTAGRASAKCGSAPTPKPKKEKSSEHHRSSCCLATVDRGFRGHGLQRIS